MYYLKGIEESKEYYLPLNHPLGLSLEKVNRESDALEAYRNACELYQAMGLNAKVQDCNNAIERLSQQDAPVAPKQGFWGWLSNFWRS